MTLEEAAHNLRSALDQAISQLTINRIGSTTTDGKMEKILRDSSFPIFRDPADWRSPPSANALPIRQRVIVENDSALVGCQSV